MLSRYLPVGAVNVLYKTYPLKISTPPVSAILKEAGME